MKIDERQQARNLFFETNFTQAQIAVIVGISEKTVSHWANEDRWRQLRQLAKQTPMMMIGEMYSEVSALNEAIRSRGSGQQYATSAEAEIRRKTLASIKMLKENQAPVVHAEVLVNFTDYVKKLNLADAQTLVKHADKYLKGEIKLGKNDGFKIYDMPPIPPDAPEQGDVPVMPPTPPTPAAPANKTNPPVEPQDFAANSQATENTPDMEGPATKENTLSVTQNEPNINLPSTAIALAKEVSTAVAFSAKEVTEPENNTPTIIQPVVRHPQKNWIRPRAIQPQPNKNKSAA